MPFKFLHFLGKFWRARRDMRNNRCLPSLVTDVKRATRAEHRSRAARSAFSTLLAARLDLRTQPRARVAHSFPRGWGSQLRRYPKSEQQNIYSENTIQFTSLFARIQIVVCGIYLFLYYQSWFKTCGLFINAGKNYRSGTYWAKIIVCPNLHTKLLYNYPWRSLFTECTNYLAPRKYFCSSAKIDRAVFLSHV